MTGAAICIVQEDKKFQWNMLVKLKFLGVFLLVVFMHALWDSPILGVVPAGHTILTVVLWILVFSMIRIGLKEIADKKLELTYSKENPTPS